MLRRIINVWPPFAFAGIHVTQIRPEFRGATVELRLHPLTRNYMGTQFGGSMYAMTDPFWVIFVINRLGPGYAVWDRRAEIEFRRPGRSDVSTTFEVTDEFVEAIREEAADGSRVLRWVTNDIVDRQGEIVAVVRRELYVRRKPAPQPSTRAAPDASPGPAA